MLDSLSFLQIYFAACFPNYSFRLLCCLLKNTFFNVPTFVYTFFCVAHSVASFFINCATTKFCFLKSIIMWKHGGDYLKPKQILHRIIVLLSTFGLSFLTVHKSFIASVIGSKLSKINKEYVSSFHIQACIYNFCA